MLNYLLENQPTHQWIKILPYISIFSIGAYTSLRLIEIKKNSNAGETPKLEKLVLVYYPELSEEKSTQGSIDDILFDTTKVFIELEDLIQQEMQSKYESQRRIKSIMKPN